MRMAKTSQVDIIIFIAIEERETCCYKKQGIVKETKSDQACIQCVCPWACICLHLVLYWCSIFGDVLVINCIFLAFLFDVLQNVGQYWFPGKGVSWYAVEEDLEDASYVNHNKFGMVAGSTVWDQYLLSFYWVAATITTNGYTICMFMFSIL